MTSAPAEVALLDDRTLEILEQRQASPVPRRRGWLVRRALLASDLVGLITAFAIVEYTFAAGEGTHRFGDPREYVAFFLSLPAWVIVGKLYGLYSRDEERTNHTTAEDVVDVFHLLTVGVWLMFGLTTLTHLSQPQVGKVFSFWALSILTVSFARVGARAYSRRQITYIQNTLIVGTDTVAIKIAKKLLKHPEYGINLVGFVDSLPVTLEDELAHVAMLGEPAEIPQLVPLLDIERVIVGFPNAENETLVSLVRELTSLDVQVDVVPRFHEVMGSAVDVNSIEGLSVIGLRPPRLDRSSALLKRAADVIGAVACLFLFSPLLALAALAVKLDSRGPILFRQTRMTRAGRTFQILKFRTMRPDADQRKQDVAHLNAHRGTDPRMFKIPNDPRVTRVGCLLRRWSIDELPQLVNVLRGEMSLVGPRPIILDEHQYVEDWAERRLDLRPGITGLWQVLGRSEIPFEEMIRLDYLYVTSWSLSLDLRLLLRTIPAALRGA